MKQVEQIKELTDIIFDQQRLINELTIENKGYKDAIDRLNDYIKSYETAIIRFDESNRGN